MKDWDDYTEQEQLLTYISDVHKDAYGFRPRGQYDDWSVEDLKVELDRLVDYANEVYEQEQIEAEKAADANHRAAKIKRTRFYPATLSC